MKLSDATAGLVVRNDRNGSYYRFERSEGDRSRIRPLEHFPNGLLIPKPAPTTVSASLEVSALSPWHDGDYRVHEAVAPRVAAKRREKYETTLAQCVVEVESLRVEYEALPVDGIGKESRGSHQNKIKAVETRIDAIQRGLAEHDPAEALECVQDVMAPRPEFGIHDLVQVPSGYPALVTAMQEQDGSWVAAISMKDSSGAALVAALPCRVLRPWSFSRVGTV